MATFIVRRRTLERHLDRADIDHLMSCEYLKPAIHESGGDVLYVRLPELLASEASRVLAEQLICRATADAVETAEWLSNVTSQIPFGDIIAAQAYVGQTRKAVHRARASRHGSHPRSDRGGNAGGHARRRRGRGRSHIRRRWIRHLQSRRTEADGSSRFGRASRLAWEPPPMDDPLAPRRTAHGVRRRRRAARPRTLGLVGSCPHVLRRLDSFMSDNGVWTHSIEGYGEVLCHAAGIVEPVAQLIWRTLSREGPELEDWIRRAVDFGSLGLLARIDVRCARSRSSPVPRRSGLRLRDGISSARRSTERSLALRNENDGRRPVGRRRCCDRARRTEGER
jgi:hypothetical protein